MRHPRDCEVHFTTLRWMGVSPSHYRARCEEPFEPTPAMRFGTLVHMLALEQPGVLVWQGDRRGKKWEEFRDAQSADAFIVTESEHDRAQRCVDALRATPHAAERLRGLHEVEIHWSWLGRQCSSRVDVLGDGFVTELKTSNSTHPERFRAACLGKLAYHAQLAFYRMAAAAWIDMRRGLKLPTPAVPRDAFIVGVETAAPFAVTVFRVPERTLENGERMARAWMERLSTCLESDQWPGYAQSVLDLELYDDDEFKLIIDGEEVEAA